MGRGSIVTSLATLSLALQSVAADGSPADPDTAAPTAPSYSPYAGEQFARGLYWGDTHVHSSWSVDAGNSGNVRVGPDEAFRFAQGEEVEADNGMRARLRRPLDFLVLTDHAEYLGVMPRLDAGDALARSTEVGDRWARYRRDGKLTQLFIEFADSLLSNRDLLENEALRAAVWKDVAANAERHNAPGRFSAFIGYEWTTSNDGNNLHRNVVFRDGADKVGRTLPFSSFDSPDPEDLWRALARYEETTGGRVLAIPHNSNLSGGRMFATETFDGRPLTRSYAESRARWEPLVEVTQYKGDSETHPFLSPDDEFADYETWNANIGGTRNEPEGLPHSYVRSALALGLELEQRLGHNPFKLGLIGSSDSHTGLAAAAEDDFWGKFSRGEPSPGRWDDAFFPEGMPADVPAYEWQMAASGYAAVWARENSREAIFDAMSRRETFATTGPRIVVRFFGGWRFEERDHASPDTARVGYAKGVPMGSDLPARASGASASPSFLVSVLKDPEGANLDRVQIVKGWRGAGGELRERVYDVAVSGGRKIDRKGRARKRVGSTVDVDSASYVNSIGAAVLATVWRDPDFDPGEPAFYYVRAIEIPTPRWTAFDAFRFGIEMSDEVPMTTQERAYTSPIWYSPAADGARAEERP